MKKTGRLFLLCIVLVFMASSCQKAYERPDVILGTNPGTGGSTGSGTSNGTLLIKAEAKTTGNTTEGSSTSYEYDANNKLIRLAVSYTDSFSVTKTIGYRYERDATGKITKIASNFFAATQPGSGFPDSIFVVVHYPTGSANFDYTKYNIDFFGISYTDSVAYTYSNGQITGRTEYTSMAGGVASAGSNTQYTYSNGNLVTLKEFDISSTTVPLVTGTIEYDGKTAALTVGNEAFLLGMDVGLVSKNNPVKETYTNSRTNAVEAQVSYALQYNSDNLPITGSLMQSAPSAKIQTLKFTYK